MVVGGWWLVIGSGRRLAVGRRWRLVAVGGWRLVAVGGSWWLAVDGPRGRSSRAVLSQKKSGFLKDRPGGRYHSEGRMQSHRRMPYTCICRDKGLLFDPPPPPAAVPLQPPTHPHQKFTKRGRKCEASLRHRPQTPPPGTTVRLLVVVRDPEQCSRKGRASARGMKLSFRVPPGHRYTIIALQNSTECCLEFTATAVIECFLGCQPPTHTSLEGKAWTGGGGGWTNQPGPGRLQPPNFARSMQHAAGGIPCARTGLHCLTGCPLTECLRGNTNWIAQSLESWIGEPYNSETQNAVFHTKPTYQSSNTIAGPRSFNGRLTGHHPNTPTASGTRAFADDKKQVGDMRYPTPHLGTGTDHSHLCN